VAATNLTNPAVTPAPVSATVTPIPTAVAPMGGTLNRSKTSGTTKKGGSIIDYPLSILMMVFGLIIGFKGLAWWKFLSIPIGIIAGFQINWTIQSAVMEHMDSNSGWKAFWLCSGISAAAFLAILMFCCKRLGAG